MIHRRNLIMGGAAALAAGSLSSPADSKSARQIDVESQAALQTLFSTRPDARTISNKSLGVLIIPEIIKAGLILGGTYGEGKLIIGGQTNSYWSYAAASLGFQAGAQKASQALFFLNQTALNTFKNGDGIEVGADAEVTIIDQGAEVDVSKIQDTTPIVAYVFGQQGLLGGVSLQGGKYSRIAR